MTSPRASASSWTVFVHQPCVVPQSLAGSASFISAIISAWVTPGPDLGITLQEGLAGGFVFVCVAWIGLAGRIDVQRLDDALFGLRLLPSPVLA